MMEKFLKNKNVNNIIKILLVLSGTILTSVLTLGEYQFMAKIAAFNILVSFGFLIYLLFFKNIFESIIKKDYFINKYFDNLICLIFTINTAKVFINNFKYTSSFLQNIILSTFSYFNMHNGINYIIVILFIAILPIIYLIYLAFIKYLLPVVKKFIKSFSKTEKMYFIFATLIFCILSLIINFKTNIFIRPIPKDSNLIVYIDVLYRSDVGVLTLEDCFQRFNCIENDLRQPLFGLFALPFGQVANLTARTFDFISYDIIYAFMISILQGICLIVISILLERMLKPKNILLTLLSYSCLFSTIFFAFNVEQYVFGLFWLIIFIYNIVMNKKTYSLLFSAISGSLITNSICLPFALINKDLKKFVKDCFKYGILFLILIIIFGQTNIVIDNLINFNAKYGTSIPFTFDRILQFLNFVSSCFVYPKSIVSFNTATIPHHYSYDIILSSTINYIGIGIIILFLISFFINRKKKIAKISFGWFLFSILVLVIIGWGTNENCLFLYSLYFGWAYYILLYLLAQNIVHKFPKMKYLFIILLLIITIINIYGMFDIVKFGIKYYPFKL